MDILADYREECAAFRALLEPDSRNRILFFHGESGCGKTTLLAHCSALMPEHVAYIPIQLRGSAVGVAEVFSRTGHRLEWDRLRRFTEQVAELQPEQRTHRVQIDRNWLVGINQHINVVLNVENSSDRHSRRVALTDAWFRDVSGLNQTVLMALDTYEAATTEVKEWLSGPFLSRVEGTGQLRVLIAGQDVPKRPNIEWGHCCADRALLGVPEAEHWWPVVQAMGRHIPLENPLIWLAGLCHGLKGRPGEIMQIIEALPRRQGAA